MWLTPNSGIDFSSEFCSPYTLTWTVLSNDWSFDEVEGWEPETISGMAVCDRQVTESRISRIVKPDKWALVLDLRKLYTTRIVNVLLLKIYEIREIKSMTDNTGCFLLLFLLLFSAKNAVFVLIFFISYYDQHCASRVEQLYTQSDTILLSFIVNI